MRFAQQVGAQIKQIARMPIIVAMVLFAQKPGARTKLIAKVPMLAIVKQLEDGQTWKVIHFITWSCLDKAKEVKHRIHLLIREWNTQEEFNRFKESNGSRGDSDIVGIRRFRL